MRATVLCRVGLHRWQHGTKERAAHRWCRRCGKKAVIDYDSLGYGGGGLTPS